MDDKIKIQEELDDYESLKTFREAKSKEADESTTSFDDVKNELNLE